MSVLVTGGAGYIGSHTVMELVGLGYDVIVLDNLQKGHRKAVLHGKFVNVDLRDLDKLDTVFKKNTIDAVIHFAADSLVGESMKEPNKYFINNVVSGINIAKCMAKHRVGRIIFSSTAATYGEPKKVPIEEKNPTIPTNPYGESKLTFEKMLRWYDSAYGIKYVSLRYFNAAGAHKSAKIGEDHDPESHLIPIVLQVALGKRAHVEVFGTDYPTPDGTCVRDYIHVTDLANAHVLALKKLEKKNAASAIYNLGNGKGFSVKQIIKVSEKVTGKTIKTVFGPRRPGDPATLVASSKRIKKELGWKPQFDSTETIVSTAWEWHRTHPDGFK
jgi:UDP-glucose 4-epimerase